MQTELLVSTKQDRAPSKQIKHSKFESSQRNESSLVTHTFQRLSAHPVDFPSRVPAYCFLAHPRPGGSVEYCRSLISHHGRQQHHKLHLQRALPLVTCPCAFGALATVWIVFRSLRRLSGLAFAGGPPLRDKPRIAVETTQSFTPNHAPCLCVAGLRIPAYNQHSHPHPRPRPKQGHEQNAIYSAVASIGSAPLHCGVWMREDRVAGADDCFGRVKYTVRYRR